MTSIIYYHEALDEERKKISDSLKGRKKSPETVEKFRNRRHSPGTKEKMRLSALKRNTKCVDI